MAWTEPTGKTLPKIRVDVVSDDAITVLEDGDLVGLREFVQQLKKDHVYVTFKQAAQTLGFEKVRPSYLSTVVFYYGQADGDHLIVNNHHCHDRKVAQQHRERLIKDGYEEGNLPGVSIGGRPTESIPA